MSLIKSLIASSDSILKIREDLGATLATVFLVQRRWTGPRPGEGHAELKKQKLFPQPAIKDYSQSIRLVEGGYIQQGDLILKSISKKRYTKDELDGTTEAKNIEKFFEINGVLYRAINVKENLITWDVQIRPLSSR